MFKTQLSSYLFPQWFKSKQETTSITIPGPIPKSFTISNNDNRLVNISMKEHIDEEAEFIDISYKQLSYAEVAELAKNKKQKNKLTPSNKPSRGRVSTNQFKTLGEEEYEIEDSGNGACEPLKSDEEYSKSRNFKNKQYETLQKKKQRNSDNKKRWKEKHQQQ